MIPAPEFYVVFEFEWSRSNCNNLIDVELALNISHVHLSHNIKVMEPWISRIAVGDIIADESYENNDISVSP